MVDTQHLRSKTIVFKIDALPKALTGTVISEEKDGFWFAGQDFVAEIAKATPLPLGMKTPAVFVPFSQLQWLMAPQD